MPNDFKKQADDLKPREKLLKAPRVGDLHDEDLLAIILKTGAEGCDVMELSRRLISHYGSVRKFVGAAADWRTLREDIRVHNLASPDRKILGVGEAKLLELAAAIELARRGIELLRGEPGDDAPLPKTVRTFADAHRVFRYALRGRSEQENFLVLPVDTRFTPLCDPIFVTRGTLSSTPVHPREVFREAIRWGAHALLVAHNHPSGDATPSAEDVRLTERLVEVSKLVSIPLVDHLVLGSSQGCDACISLRQAKLVEF